MKNNQHHAIQLDFNKSKRAVIGQVIVIGLLLPSTGCDSKPKGTAALENRNANSSGAPAARTDAAPILERYRALDKNRDGTTRLRATISGGNGSSELGGPRKIEFNMYRKSLADGRLLILIEFTEPAEERDRDGLITVFPDGQVEGVRYVQSTDSYLATRDIMAEDALFGLTLQELADGQSEKYDFTITGEETVEGTACYRAEGKLKHGAGSKFPRVVLMISTENFAAVQAKFYDNHDQLARDLVVSKTEQIAGRWTRVRWKIDNPSRGKKIEFEAVDVKYNENLKDSIFTREYLKKISSR
jgi:hypothetical protein